MPDMEKVIKGLECCTFILGKRKCDECPYAKGADYGPDCYSLMPDVKALLKAQEPRVMTLEEVEKSYSKAPIWFEEQRLQTVYPAIYHKSKGPEGAKFADITDFYYQRQDWAYGTYGETWRCWTSRPADEQREAVKWE